MTKISDETNNGKRVVKFRLTKEEVEKYLEAKKKKEESKRPNS